VSSFATDRRIGENCSLAPYTDVDKTDLSLVLSVLGFAVGLGAGPTALAALAVGILIGGRSQRTP
jgi:hypothetical protein